MNKEMKRRGLYGLTGILAGLVLVGGLHIGKNMKTRARDLNWAASMLAHKDYVPVGNGGANAEIHGRVTPERKRMYENCRNTYIAKRFGQAPIRTFAEYDLMTMKDLSEEEKDELRKIIDRYDPLNWDN